MLTRPARLSDVAARAGVSTATVSKVLNGRPEVAEATRQRVWSAAQDLDYDVSSLKARGEATDAGIETVAVAFHSIDNSYGPLVMAGMMEAAQRLGVALWPAQQAQDSAAEASSLGRGSGVGSVQWMHERLRWGADAIILVTTAVTEEQARLCERAGVPLVAVDPVGKLPATVRTVGSTNWRGGVQAVEHLRDHGHRRMAFGGSPAQSVPGSERLAGFRSALEAAGIEPDARYIRRGSFRFEDGLAMQSMLRYTDRPTAVVAASDAVAFGVLEAARREGLAVPGDLSIVGFDDSFICQFASPELTSVRQPLAEIGDMALEGAVRCLRGDPPAAKHLHVATTVAVRQSTGPAPAA